MLNSKLVLKLLPFYLLMVVVFSWPFIHTYIVKHSAAKANAIRLANVEARKEPTVSGKPVELKIPRLKLKLSVQNGQYDLNSNTWQINRDDAFYAQDTAPLSNKEGNTLIYGHNISSVFKRTEQLSKGDQLIIKADNGLKFEYFYGSSTNVDPHDLSILAKKPNQPEVTLLTCDGAFFQKRRLMKFSYLRML